MPSQNIEKYFFLRSKGDLGIIIRDKDWSNSVLGNPDDWPLNLKYALNICLNSAFPMGLYWGKDRIFFYNDAYRPIMGEKHPWAIGRKATETIPEVWAELQYEFENVFKEGVSIRKENTLLIMQRHGYNEECYFDYSLSPIWNDDGTVDGIFNTIIETTYEVINNRRNHLLNELAKHSNDSKSIEEECEVLTNLFENYPQDIAFHILYLRNPKTNRFEAKTYSKLVKEEHLNKNWPFEQVLENEEMQLEFLGSYINNIKDPRWNENCVEACLIPVGDSNDLEGVLIVGLSPRKRFGINYKSFLKSIEVHVKTSLINARSFEQKAYNQRIIEENEQRLKIAIETTHIGAWDYNPVSDHLICSNRTREILGIPMDGKMHLSDVVEQICDEDKGIMTRAIAKALDNVSSGVLDVEYRLKKKQDELPKWVKCKGQVFFDENGEPYRFIGTALDISIQKNAEKELKLSLERFKLLADSMSHHIWVINPDGEVDYVNNSVINNLGADAEQKMRFAGLEYVHPEEKQLHMDLWKKSMETGDEFLIEHRLLFNGGNYKWMMSRALPQKGLDGKIKIWVGSSMDIQEHKNFTDKLEKEVAERTYELKLANSELEKMNQELASFAYVSSHDLQEPLRKIRTFVERIVSKEEGKLSETGKDYLNRMQKAAERMQKLIVDLLSYSRTNTSKKEFEKCNLNEIISEILNDLDQRIMEKNARIKVVDLPALNAIPFQVKQLFTNLISNALKFSKSEGECIIRIYYEDVSPQDLPFEGDAEKRKFCKITVEDKGIGFEQEFSNKIFEVFQRLHGRDKYSGTGIGLAICMRIVENHSGYIEAEGKKGEGAIFRVYLPYNN